MEKSKLVLLSALLFAASYSLYNCAEKAQQVREDEKDWAIAQKADNADSYWAFTKKHPKSPMYKEAEKRLDNWLEIYKSSLTLAKMALTYDAEGQPHIDRQLALNELATAERAYPSSPLVDAIYVRINSGKIDEAKHLIEMVVGE